METEILNVTTESIEMKFRISNMKKEWKDKDKYPNSKHKNQWNKKAFGIYQNFTIGTPYWTDQSICFWHQPILPPTHHSNRELSADFAQIRLIGPSMLAQEAKITIQSPYSSPFSLTCGLTTDRVICNDIMYKTETTPIFHYPKLVFLWFQNDELYNANQGGIDQNPSIVLGVFFTSWTCIMKSKKAGVFTSLPLKMIV